MEQPPPIPQYQPPGSSQTSAPKPPKRRRESLRSALSTIALFIAAPLVALAITSFVFQSYEVDGPSMQETLQNRDRLIVLKLPRTWSRLTKQDYIPARGAIIVFAKKGMLEEGESKEKQLIKRVVGLPGEHVIVEDGRVRVYNNAHPEGFNPDTSGGYTAITQTTAGRVDLTIPEGEIFVLGDNRSDSRDSRNFGTVTAEEIVGELKLRIMPLSKARSF